MAVKYRLNGVLMSEAQVKSLVRAGLLDARVLKNTPASTSLANSQTFHGPNQGGTSATEGGLFSDGRVRPQRFSALQRPRGILDAVPVLMTDIVNELTEILTGQLDNTGTDATGFCGNPPAAGALKTVRINRTFGDFYMKTQLQPLATVGGRLHYADVPAEILNSAQASAFLPDVLTQLDTSSQLAMELYKLGVAVERAVTRVVWRGVAGQNNVTNDGFFNEPAGLYSIVATGYVDHVTGTPAPAADSVVIDWNGADIGATVGGRDIVAAVHDLYYSVAQRADAVGMRPDFAFVMRRELFRRLTEVYACNYASSRCGGTAGNPVPRDGFEVTRLRDEMMAGSYLLVDGVPVPVILDEGLRLERASATDPFSSDLFIVPLSDAGRPLTYVQAFDMSNASAREYANMLASDRYRVLNNGLYLVGYRSTGMCDEYHFQMRMRPILETPFLAGRIDEIEFEYLAQTRTSQPGSPLYQDGGVTFRDGVPVEPPTP